MKLDRRSVGKGLFALGAVVVGSSIPGASPPPAACSSKTNSVTVQAAPGSDLDFDDAVVLDVRDTLTDIVRQNPSCIAGKVGDVLRGEYGSRVSESEFEPEYIFKLVDGHWVHFCTLLTRFEIDFGSNRTVRVDVEVSEIK